MNIFLKNKLDRSKPNRRDFLLQSTAASLGVTSIVNTLAQLKLVGSAAAQGAGGDYKALVCLFLNGGNDANNLVVPTDASPYSQYQRARPNLALPQVLLQPFMDYAFGFRRGVNAGQPADNAGPRAELPLPYNGIPGGSR